MNQYNSCSCGQRKLVHSIRCKGCSAKVTKRHVKRHKVVQPDDQSIRYIALTNNQNAIVDAPDYEWLSQWNWSAHWDPKLKSFYAQRFPSLSMARIIVGVPSGINVDHKNHNTLDNRRTNLRPATQTQNLGNARKRLPESGYRGVWKVASKLNPWAATITKNGEMFYLGCFPNPEAAYGAYKAKAKELYGEFRLESVS